jgi:hypothetical protein
MVLKLVIDLIDRRKNFCPALFFITEISRIDTDHSSIHFLPVNKKLKRLIACTNFHTSVFRLKSAKWSPPFAPWPRLRQCLAAPGCGLCPLRPSSHGVHRPGAPAGNWMINIANYISRHIFHTTGSKFAKR